jgi:hypothetical protein
MPDITFTARERQRVNAIIDELDPADHELLCPYQDMISAEDWQFVCDYTRAKMRSVLETGLLVASVAERARVTDLVGEETIRNNFVRSLWTYDFSFRKAIEDTFVAVAGGRKEAPLCLATEALVDLAEDLMFATFEDAHERLLDGAAS